MQPHRVQAPSALANSMLYRIERDALAIAVSHSAQAADLAAMESRLIFVRGRLCVAALAEPSVSAEVRAALVRFHGESLRAMIRDLRARREEGL